MRRRATPLLVWALILGGCTETAAPPPPKLPRTVALVTGVTGPTAAWGEVVRRGAEIAVHDCNRQAPRGALLTFAVEDDGGRPEQTSAVVQKLVADPSVIAIIGADSSSGTLAAAPIIEREKVVMITPTASAPMVTQGKKYLFRVCPTDDLEAITVARLAVERLGARRVAILRDTRNDYSVGMTSTFSGELQRRGGTVAATLDYAAGDSEFRPQLTTILAQKPELLFIPGYYGDVAQIARQLRDLGSRIPIAGGSGWDSPKLVEIGGEALEGGWFVGWIRSGAPAFVDAFKKQYGSVPDGAAALAYDAVGLVCRSLNEFGDRPRSDLRDRIANTRDYSGASGTITIENQNARKPLAVFQIEKGAFVERGTIAAK